MVRYRIALVPAPLFILGKQSPAFGLPQIKEFSRLFVEKANEVRLSIRVFAGCSSYFSYGTPFWQRQHKFAHLMVLLQLTFIFGLTRLRWTS